MKRKIVTAVCCAIALCALPGCMLAREDMQAAASGDKMIGVLVTREYLDQFDLEGYIKDNPGSLNGGEITLDGNAQKYQDRLYATERTKTTKNEETGQAVTTDEFVFESIAGMSFFSPTVQAAEDNGSYVATMSDEAFCDVSAAFSLGDDKTSTALEATIYISSAIGDVTFYFNPVYQDAAGGVYAVGGNGMSASGMNLEGSEMTQTLDSSNTVTEDGKTKTDSTSIKITVKGMALPEKTVILQMDADNTLISRAEYMAGGMPSSLTPDAAAEYLIIEIHSLDASGAEVVTREIYGVDKDSFTVFSLREDGICIGSTIQIVWK